MSFLSYEEFFHSPFRIAVFCQRNRNPAYHDTYHSGIIAKTEDEGIKIYHLGWHKQLRKDDCPRGQSIYVGIKQMSEDLDGHRIVTNNFIQHLNTVVKEYKDTMPYGLQFSDLMSFSLDDEFIKSDPAVGLTCSTFVIAVLNAFAKPIIDYKTWQRRPSDQTWKQYVIHSMIQSNQPLEHIQKIIQEEVKYRIQPEEVVCGPTTYPVPAPFNYCVEHSKRVVELLSA